MKISIEIEVVDYLPIAFVECVGEFSPQQKEQLRSLEADLETKGLTSTAKFVLMSRDEAKPALDAIVEMVLGGLMKER